MNYVAVDPGAKAGFSIITENGSLIAIACKDNASEAYKILRKLKPEETLVAIEKVHAIFGAAASTTFSFGCNVGKWLGIFNFLGLSYTEVAPRDWQRAVTNSPDVPKTKGLPPAEARALKIQHKLNLKMESFRAAQNAFPDTRLPTHDVSDSVNIARYLQLKHQGKIKERI